MSKTIKITLLSTAVLLVVGYFVFVCIYRRVDHPTVCKSFKVLLTDSLERQYVTSDEVVSYLGKHGITPLRSVVSTDSVERVALSHPMVRTAECHKTIANELVLRVTQRKPILRVTNGGETYLVDEERKIMPAWASVKTPLMEVTGDVGKRMAQSEMYDFVTWVHRNPFWNGKIRKVRVNTAKDIVLIQNEGAPILIGSMDDFQGKLNKLQTWYTKSEGVVDPAVYSKIDTRYKGQIIGQR